MDVFYAEALQSREEMRAVREALPDCLFLITTLAIDPPLSEAELRDFGVCMSVCFPSQAGSVAMYDYLRDVRQRGQAAVAEFQARTRGHPMGRFGVFDLTGFRKVSEWEERYLDPRQRARYDSSLGMYDPRVGQAPSAKAKA